ncbi:hypothetical protein LQW54_012407 [Pestalotiopsis sp. IQ-011]
MQYYNTIYGMGGGVAESPVNAAEEIIASRKIDWCMIVIEKPAFGFIKLSILFFYRRIFGIWPNVRHLNTFLIGLVAAWTLAFLVADLLLCGVHPELNWAYDQRDSHRGGTDHPRATGVQSDILGHGGTMARDLGGEPASMRASAEGLSSVPEAAQPLCKDGIVVLVQNSQEWLESENT